MLDMISGLLSLAGAVSFLGEDVAKAAVKHYAPKAFDRLDETVEGIFASLSRGEIKEAQNKVEASGLIETLETSITELKRQTIVVSLPDMDNEYVARANMLEQITDFIFDTSRRWQMDLLLPGGLSGDCALTLFQTSHLPKARFEYPFREIGFIVTNGHHAMWVLTQEKAAAASITPSELLGDYRKEVVALRGKFDKDYIGLSKELRNLFMPMLSVDGGSINGSNISGDRLSLIDNEYHKFDLRGLTELSLDDWANGVTKMEDALRQIPSWLRLSAAEKAAIEVRLGQSAETPL